MPTVLRDDQQARIDELIRQGAYADPQAALDDALTLAERKARLRALVQEGSDAIERGEIVDHDTVFRTARQRIAEIAAEQQAAAGVG